MWNFAGQRALVVTAALAASVALAAAQQGAPVCQRLETQLAALDRGNVDPAQAEQTRRYEEALNRQQFELDKLVAQQRRMGCERGFFSVFGLGGSNTQCVELDSQIDRMRGNISRMQMESRGMQGSNLQRGEQRREVLLALADYNCGPQYRQAQRPGFLDSLFGNTAALPDQPGTGARTLCVRTCDGYYFPVNGARGGESDAMCQRMCPAAEVALYSQRANEDVGQAVSLSGQPYSALPAAFKYRQAFDPSCSCRKTGQSWADALKHLDDNTVERGDIVVDDQRAKQLSRPDQGRGAKPDQRSNRSDAKAEVTGSTPSETKDDVKADTKRKVRSVGTPFITGQ